MTETAEIAGTPTRAGRNVHLIGADRHNAPAVGHRLVEGGVAIILPRHRPITETEARRLAWGILADLAPDEVGPMPDIVTYREAQRLAVMRHLADGAATLDEIADGLGWKRRKTERMVSDLVADGRVSRRKVDQWLTLFSISRNNEAQA